METTSRIRLPKPPVLYAALIASLVLTWVVPQESLVSLPIVARFLERYMGGDLTLRTRRSTSWTPCTS